MTSSKSLDTLLQSILSNNHIDRQEVDQLELQVFSDGIVDAQERQILDQYKTQTEETPLTWIYEETRINALFHKDVTDVLSYKNQIGGRWEVRVPNNLFRATEASEIFAYTNRYKLPIGGNSKHDIDWGPEIPKNFSNSNIPSIFYGECEDICEEATAHVFEVLPKGFQKFLTDENITAHFRTKQQIRNLINPESGLSNTVNAFVDLDINQNLHVYAPNNRGYTMQFFPLIHEFGHITIHALEKKVSHDPKRLSIDLPQSIARKHYDQIKDFWSQLPSPIHVWNAEEWYAEAFVFYILGKGDWGEAGVGSIPFAKNFYHNWKQRDPVFYLLFTSFEWACENNKDLTRVFTSEMYENAKAFASNHPELTQEDLDEWKNKGLQNTITMQLEAVINNFVLTEEGQLEEIYRIAQENPSYKFPKEVLAYRTGSLLSRQPADQVQLSFEIDFEKWFEESGYSPIDLHNMIYPKKD